MHERVNFTKPRNTVNPNKNLVILDYNQMIKGTRMQIYYIFLCVFAHIKTTPENVAFLIVRILNLFAREDY